MFDLGFWELLIVGIIALIVLGPERLPVAARTVGRWVGKARAYTRSLSSELNREVQLRELREKLSEAERELKSGVSSVEKEMRALDTQGETPSGSPPATAPARTDDGDPAPAPPPVTASAQQVAPARPAPETPATPAAGASAPATGASPEPHEADSEDSPTSDRGNRASGAKT